MVVMLRWMLWAALAVAVLLAMDRLALRAEARGWIYYRKTKRRTGANLGDAFLEIQATVEPSKRHVLEMRREEKSEQNDSGDPPQSGEDPQPDPP
jgi:hypothetical protein